MELRTIEKYNTENTKHKTNNRLILEINLLYFYINNNLQVLYA